MEEMTNAYILAGKPEGTVPLGRPRSSVEYNIKMDFKTRGVTVSTGFNWLGTGFSGGVCEHGNIHSGSKK
jgi:hypothetical protein